MCVCVCVCVCVKCNQVALKLTDDPNRYPHTRAALPVAWVYPSFSSHSLVRCLLCPFPHPDPFDMQHTFEQILIWIPWIIQNLQPKNVKCNQISMHLKHSIHTTSSINLSLSASASPICIATLHDTYIMCAVCRPVQQQTTTLKMLTYRRIDTFAQMTLSIHALASNVAIWALT